MNPSRTLRWAFLAAGLGVVTAAPVTAGETKSIRRPNVIFILADDLGYAEVGCYGQKKIRTPSIDRLAAQGMRFTQYYAGSAVCAPSRCVLMTGKHTGHAFIRNNREVKPEGQYPIPADTVTLAKLLKAAGYVTGAIGKWGLGPPGSEGDSIRQGFDLFFGYNCQRHAHNHYPQYLWRNDKKVAIEGNPGGATGQQFAQDLFEKEALAFISANKDRPFFLYLPFIIPHLALQVPEDSLAEYKGRWDDPPYQGGKGYLPHPHPRAAYAAMITRMDRTIGRILDLLHKLGLDEDTIVCFSSDNGATYDRIGGSDSDFFSSTGPFRGYKGSLHEGGLRVPFIVRWTGKIRPESTSSLPCAAYDVLPTLCELSGAKPPKDIDGLSLAPTLLGKGKQKEHAFLYWEFPGYGGQQAIRIGNWKGIRKNLAKGASALELYDLAKDIGEKNNIANQHPKIVEQMLKLMSENRTPSKEFPMKLLDAPQKSAQRTSAREPGSAMAPLELPLWSAGCPPMRAVIR